MNCLWSGLSVTLPFAFASCLCLCRKAKFASDSAGRLCELNFYIIEVNYSSARQILKILKFVGQQSVHTSETLCLANSSNGGLNVHSRLAG